MINRGNWKLYNEYLQYREEVHQLQKKSVRLEKTWLKHLLVWADDYSFKDIQIIRPAFPTFVLSDLSGGKGKHLSLSYVKKVVSAAKRFLEWLSIHKKGYRSITPQYLDTLRVPKFDIEPKERKIVSYEEILEIAKAPVKTTKEERIRAALVILWLSGIRAGAFVTLTLSAVDLDNLEIKVWPSLGVRVKNKKGRTVHLYNDPILLLVVRKWDKKVREVLPDNGLWFAHLTQVSGEIDPIKNINMVGKNRYRILYKDMKRWLEKVGLPFKSPHMFRHGNAVHEIKIAKTFDKVKAISQNLGHQSVVTTDSIYGGLSDTDVKRSIASLSKRNNINSDIDEEDFKEYLEFQAFKQKLRNG